MERSVLSERGKPWRSRSDRLPQHWAPRSSASIWPRSRGRPSSNCARRGSTTRCWSCATSTSRSRNTLRSVVGFDPLFAIHDFSMTFGRRLSDEERAEKQALYPPARHPVIRTHPETGQRTIYTNRSFVREVEGCTPEESAEIVGHLERQIMNPSVQCRIRWSVDTFVMWDNRAVQHFATDDFWPETRHVERVTVVGDAPF
ncbi:MAG: hypothetical protein EBY52_01435 [Actinobacteria bacterium]|nr:hypothetical protein [Actinomycetota bacterium]